MPAAKGSARTPLGPIFINVHLMFQTLWEGFNNKMRYKGLLARMSRGSKGGEGAIKK